MKLTKTEVEDLAYDFKKHKEQKFDPAFKTWKEHEEEMKIVRYTIDDFVDWIKDYWK